MGQKGFSPIIIVLLIAALGVGVFVGQRTKLIPSLYKGSSGQSSLSLQPTASGVTVASPNTSSASLNSAPIPRPKSSFSATSDVNRVTITDQFTIPPDHKTSYTLSFPKSGGEVNGALSGFCSGTISGSMEIPNPDKQSQFKANLVAKCQPYVGFAFQSDMQADFEGQADFKTDKLHITYEFHKPYFLRGEVDLNFTP